MVKKNHMNTLIKSIEQFINQEELIDLMKKNNFIKCSYRNFSGGVVSIHSGWKILMIKKLITLFKLGRKIAKV